MSLAMGIVGWGAIGHYTSTHTFKSITYSKLNLNISSLGNIGLNGSYSSRVEPVSRAPETTDEYSPNPTTGITEKKKESSNNGAVQQPTITETTDVYDANSHLLSTNELRVLLPLFQSFGCRRAFSGQVVTVKSFEDNAVAIETVIKTSTDGGVPLGLGKVLVIDGGGSLRRAMVGSLFAKMAHKMGWVGILVNGCVRDVDEIDSIDIGVRSLGTVPIRPNKIGGGEVHVPVHFAGVWIRDGDWLCADRNGILVASRELSMLGPTHRPVHCVNHMGASLYTHLMADYTSPVEPHRLFKAHFLEDHVFMPKFLPESFKSIEFVRGDSTAIGAVKKINYVNGRSLFKNATYRVDELDVEKLYIKYTIIEGDILEDKWESIVYETKVEAYGTGSRFTMRGYYNAKVNGATNENDVDVHREGLKNSHKAIQEYLLFYPALYA